MKLYGIRCGGLGVLESWAVLADYRLEFSLSTASELCAFFNAHDTRYTYTVQPIPEKEAAA